MRSRDGSAWSVVTATSSISILGSHKTNAWRTSCAMRPAVVALLTAKTRSWMPQPKSGRIMRSPLAVPRTIQMAWRMLSSRRATAICCVASSVWTGNCQPTPRKSLSMRLPLLVCHPIMTVPTATTLPTGVSTGSLQVMATSPWRAAALPLILTVGLPTWIVPLLAGGF